MDVERIGGGWSPIENRDQLLYIIEIYQLEPAMDTAKVFWSGRSQAIRLPKEFRFDGTEVRIRRQGNAVILEPIAEGWQWLDAIAGPLDDAFVQATEEQTPGQQRPDLDFFE